MEKQTKPKRSKTPTFRDVLVGTDTIYRPLLTDKSTDSVISDKMARSRAFLNEFQEYKKKFIPDVTFVKLVTTDTGLDLHIKVHDVEHQGKKIYAWDFYKDNPQKVEEKIREYLSEYDDLDVSNIRFEKGSLLVIIGIKLVGIGAKKLVGAAIATGLTWALTIYYNNLKNTPEGREKIEKIEKLEKNVISTIKGFVDDTISKVKDFFGGWFGGFATGW